MTVEQLIQLLQAAPQKSTVVLQMGTTGFFLDGIECQRAQLISACHHRNDLEKCYTPCNFETNASEFYSEGETVVNLLGAKQ
jgi:hypothetical protein